MIEKDAIEILKSIQNGLEETRFLERCAIDMAIKALKEQRPHGEWIPCSERLPEDPDTKRIYASKTYQVTTDDGRTMVLRWCKTEIRGKIVMRWEWHDGRIYHGNVLAWKPLSEPYRKEGEAE